MVYLGTPKNPLRDVLHAATGAEPPPCTLGIYSSTELSESQQEHLQSWCSDNAKPHWTTGIGLMDAADAIVAEAVANGNIPPQRAPTVEPKEETP